MSLKVRSRVVRIALCVLAGVVLLSAAVVALLPFLLPRLSFSTHTFDLSEQLSSELRPLFRHHDLTVRPGFVRSPTNDVSLRCRGRFLDWHYAFDADLDYSLWNRSTEGSFTLSLASTQWKINGRFAGSTTGGWTVDAALPATSFDAEDPFFSDLLHKAMGSAMTNLENFACSGKFGLTAHAATTNGLALPTWTVRTSLTDLQAAVRTGEQDFALKGLRLHAGVTGLGPHFDIAPMFPRADAIEIGAVALTNAFASVRATERSYLVTEAGADLCGGQVRLYALFLDPSRLNAGVTLFLDNIDTGMVLNRLSGFHGSATGKLHGKLPLRLSKGERIALGDSYLYSIPGETGTLAIDDATAVLDDLAASGVSATDCQNLSRALRCLTYSALKLDLRKEEDGSHALNFKLEGTATEGKVTVPVSFDVTLHGAIEELINTGLKAAGR